MATNSESIVNSAQAIKRALLNMVIESWRLSRVFERLLMKLDAGEQKRYQSQFRWFIRKIEESLEQVELKLVNLEGQVFDPGMPATPLNIEEFDVNDVLMVEQMLEPVIMGKEGLVRTGTVILAKRSI